MPRITLHHLNVSRSERIVWLLEELGVPYDLKVHYRVPAGGGPKSLKDVHALGKAPALDIDGKVYVESGAIVHELITKFAKPGSGIETTPSSDSTFWSHYSEGTMMLNLQAAKMAQLGVKGLAARGGKNGGPMNDDEKRGAAAVATFFGQATGGVIQSALAEVERFLSKNTWFSGTDELGEGDFMMEFGLNSLATGGRKGTFTLGPATMAWVDRVAARPGFKRAMERIAKEEKGQAKL